MHNLDPHRVRRLIEAGRPGMYPDGDGLFLRVREGRSAAWTFRYRFGGRDVWLPIGDAANMSLTIARQAKRSARVLIDQGRDPLRERRAVQEAAEQRWTFSALAERWYEHEIAKRYKHPEPVRRALDKYLVPKLGRKAADEITPAHCAALLDEVRYEHPAAANDLLRYLKAIFAFGRRRHVVAGSPISDFTARLDGGGTESKRTRALSRTEMAELLKAMRETAAFGGQNALAVKLLLALCVRKGELLGAKWDEFDLEGTPPLGPVWRLPKERTKTGAGLDIPLAPPVVAWLRALQTVAGASPWLFPARRRDPRAKQEHIGVDTLNVAMSRLTLDLPAFTLHDLRRTARTQLAALGVRSEVAERCLNHQLKGVEGTYNQHDYFHERRDALTQWAAIIVDVERGDRKVVPIGKRSG